jgi:hypothetical protein
MWEYSAPLIAPEKRDRNTSVAQKDPTVVFHGGKWHVFMTVKLPGRTAIEYCSFARWEDAGKSKRTMVKVSESKYFGAPQAFFFVPHKKWYLIYQVGVPGAKFMWVAYSMAADVADPGSWTPARPILDGGPKDPRKVGGLDYWIICDDQRAYLFLTSLDGKMWRLVNGEDRPTWTSDGQSLVYRTELSGIDRYDLTIIAADGVGGPANYTNTSNRRERGPAWNPQWDPLGPGAF